MLSFSNLFLKIKTGQIIRAARETVNGFYKQMNDE